MIEVDDLQAIGERRESDAKAGVVAAGTSVDGEADGLLAYHLARDEARAFHIEIELGVTDLRSHLGSALQALLLEAEHPSLRIHPDGVLRRELAFQDRFRQRILDLLLDRALERPRAVDRIESGFRKLGHCRVAELDAHVHSREP